MSTWFRNKVLKFILFKLAEFLMHGIYLVIIYTSVINIFDFYFRGQGHKLLVYLQRESTFNSILCISYTIFL